MYIMVRQFIHIFKLYVSKHLLRFSNTSFQFHGIWVWVLDQSAVSYFHIALNPKFSNLHIILNHEFSYLYINVSPEISDFHIILNPGFSGSRFLNFEFSHLHINLNHEFSNPHILNHEFSNPISNFKFSNLHILNYEFSNLHITLNPVFSNLHLISPKGDEELGSTSTRGISTSEGLYLNARNIISISIPMLYF